MTVPARRRKIFERSHMWRSTTRNTGRFVRRQFHDHIGVAPLSSVFLNSHAISKRHDDAEQIHREHRQAGKLQKTQAHVLFGMHAAISSV